MVLSLAWNRMLSQLIRRRKCDIKVCKAKYFEGFAPERGTNPFPWVSSCWQQPEQSETLYCMDKFYLAQCSDKTETWKKAK